MDRRSFLKSATATGLAVGLCKTTANAYIPEHNWDKYDWGSGPPVLDRLYQGPSRSMLPVRLFPRARSRWSLRPPRTSSAITAWASRSMPPTTPDYFMSPVKRRTDARRSDQAALRAEDLHPPQLARCPKKAWSPRFSRSVGKLPSIWRAATTNASVSESCWKTRLPRSSMPDFLLNKVPYVKLKGEWKGDPKQMRYRKDNRVPQYDHPAYQAAFRELNGLLAAELNGIRRSSTWTR